MKTMTTSRIRRTGLASAAAIVLTLAANASPSDAASTPDLRQSCERAGGTFSGDGSIRPTCHDARLLSPFTWHAHRACSSIHGLFALQFHDDWRRVSWQCDTSRL
jgi:hypothetical protein